ncbi:MAG: DUF3892 domain-containing protein [Anaerolineae bacterium]|nr:DUF3892 domain-containing protein [Anaerolineae bacterium]
MYNQTAPAEFALEKRRSNKQGVIESLFVWRRDGGQLVQLDWYPRQSIVNHINDGHTYMTVNIKEGKWIQGADVHVVKTAYGEYLRTDRNQIAADNLDNLPEG